MHVLDIRYIRIHGSKILSHQDMLLEIYANMQIRHTISWSHVKSKKYKFKSSKSVKQHFCKLQDDNHKIKQKCYSDSVLNHKFTCNSAKIPKFA